VTIESSHKILIFVVLKRLLLQIKETNYGRPALQMRSCGHYIFVLWFLLSSSIFYLCPRLISAVADWMSTIYFHTWCGLTANLGCRSETCCCTRLAENTGR